MKLHINKAETLAERTKFECEACGIIFREADLSVTCQHKGLGKYTVTHDPYDSDCPACHRPLGEVTETIEHAVSSRSIDNATKVKMRKLYDAELRAAEADYRRIKAEGTDLISSHSYNEWHEEGDAIRCRNNQDIGTLIQAQSRHADAIMAVSELRASLADPLDDYRTETQNCISHGCTIKPQVNWNNFDKDYGHLVRKV